jgi:phospholipid/cholesterol/gamma-HCH transport system ATP-binding protein
VTDPKGDNRQEISGLFGMVFQEAALLASLTIAENVGLGLRENRLYPEPEIERIIAEKLEMVGLKDAANALPAQLSGGMRRRAGLARALAMNPEIMLYDEPTAGLDPLMSDNVDEMIKEMKERLKMTSIVVTHDMISAFGVADRIAMLHQGAIVEIGTPDDIRRSRNPIVQEFIAREGASVNAGRK